MDSRSRSVLIIAFVAAFLVVGLPYWLIPYKQTSLPTNIVGPQLIVVAGLAGFARIMAGTGLWRTTAIIGGAVPAAVMARVIVEVTLDPSSHNLWPFEIVLALGPGFVPAFVGALVGWGFVAMRRV